MLETEAAPLIEKNYRWNFTVNVLDGATFWFGMSFLSSAVILPLFVSHFTSSPALIGLIAFLTAVGPLLPQLLVAKAVAQAPRKIVFPACIGFSVERLPLIILLPRFGFWRTVRLFGFSLPFSFSTRGIAEALESSW